MHHDKRQLKRVHLIYYLRIFDSNTGVNVGHLVDITTQGIMMISEEKVPVGEDFSFRMQLPATITGREEIQFSARCLWCKKDFNPDFYVSGYQIKEISSQEVKTITALMNAYGFKSM
ncbi:MAG: PilZ domain-containing protein [Deltaproteobacteria bacterium]|jgi:hypothetical protein|nr:MAG: PilZ domain-containing protein [Deltaproteobacteria bacterium]